MQPERAQTPCVVVEVDESDVDRAEPIEAKKKSVEYVRIDEWQAPPSVRELESRVEPRGNEPPQYIRMPPLTLHREIAPMTTWRHGRYWH